MRNLIANFVRIFGIWKISLDRVNVLRNIPRCGGVTKFSDLEVFALGITAEAYGFNGENFLFHRPHKECKDNLPNLISYRQFNGRLKLTAGLAEEIREDVVIAIDGTQDVFCIDFKPVNVCQNATQWFDWKWLKSFLQVSIFRIILTKDWVQNLSSPFAHFYSRKLTIVISRETIGYRYISILIYK